jgi:hypothetical protein
LPILGYGLFLSIGPVPKVVEPTLIDFRFLVEENPKILKVTD